MRPIIRPWWALLALALTFAACGAAEPDRLSLRTPGANTGDPNFVPLPTTTPTPSATPTPTATAKPKRKSKPVTKDEKQVIKGWSEELRHGHVTAAARYFSLPTLISDSSPGWLVLETLHAVKQFNRGLPCGAKLISTRRSRLVTRFVVGTFRLTERPGPGKCGDGTGHKLSVAFVVRRHHITRWVRDDTLTSPSGSATPSPSPTATATATPTPTDTPTPTPTPASTGVPGLA
jgi:hypothetical protein